MAEIICKRKFGASTITINNKGHISIINMHQSNYGLIYGCNISDFHAKLPCQIIGMDYQPCKTHTAYIHSRIKAGLFDHLISTKESNHK